MAHTRTDTVVIQPGWFGIDYVRLTDDLKRLIDDSLRPEGGSVPPIRFVCRYDVPPESTRIGKVITDDEIAWLFSRGVAIFLNWELSPSEPSQGRSAGLRAGEYLQRMCEQRGYPNDVPPFVSVDTNTVDANVFQHVAFCLAFAQQCAPGPWGIYGDTDIGQAMQLFEPGPPMLWRAAAASWGGPNDPITYLQQRPSRWSWGVGSTRYDPNYCTQPINAWLPAEHHRADHISPGTPDTPEEQIDMVIVTNSQTYTWTEADASSSPAVANSGTAFGPDVVKWVYTEAGSLRHVRNGWEAQALIAVGCPLVRFSNVQLAALPRFVPPAPPTPPQPLTIGATVEFEIPSVPGRVVGSIIGQAK